MAFSSSRRLPLRSFLQVQRKATGRPPDPGPWPGRGAPFRASPRWQSAASVDPESRRPDGGVDGPPPAAPGERPGWIAQFSPRSYPLSEMNGPKVLPKEALPRGPSTRWEALVLRSSRRFAPPSTSIDSGNCSGFDGLLLDLDFDREHCDRVSASARSGLYFHTDDTVEWNGTPIGVRGHTQITIELLDG